MQDEAMCTKKDVREIVETVVNERDSQMFWSLVKLFAIPFVLLVFAIGGAYMQIGENTEFRKEGGQFTVQQQSVFETEVDRRFSEQQSQIVQLRQDLNSSITDVNNDLDKILNILLSR